MIVDYESGRALPNQQIVAKMERALGEWCTVRVQGVVTPTSVNAGKSAYNGSTKVKLGGGSVMWAMIYSSLRKHKPDLHSFVYKYWRSL